MIMDMLTLVNWRFRCCVRFSGTITVTISSFEVQAVVQKSSSKSARERLEELRQARVQTVEHKAHGLGEGVAI